MKSHRIPTLTLFLSLFLCALTSRPAWSQGPPVFKWLRGGDYLFRWQSALFRDNASLLTASDQNGTVKLRRISDNPLLDGTIVWTINTGLNPSQIAVSPDGQYLAVSGGVLLTGQNVLQLWRLSDHTRLHTVDWVLSGGAQVAFSPDSSRLCCPSNGKIWSIPSFAETLMSDPEYAFPNGAMADGFWHPSGGYFTVPCYDGRGGSRSFDGVTGALVHQSGNASMNGYSPTGDYRYYIGTILGLGIRGVLVSDMWGGGALLAGGTSAPRAVEYVDGKWTGNSIFAVSSFGSVYPDPPMVDLWVLPPQPWSVDPTLTGKRFTNLPATFIPSRMDVSPNQAMMSITGANNAPGAHQFAHTTSFLDLYGTSDYVPGVNTAPRHRYIDHAATIRSISMSARARSPYGHILATGDSCGQVFLWSAVSGLQLNRDHPIDHIQGINTVSVSPDGHYLVIGAEPQYGAVGMIWDIGDPANPQPVSSPLNNGWMVGKDGVQAEVVAAAFSPDGTLIATRSVRGVIGLWKRDPSTGIWTERARNDGATQGQGGSRVVWSLDGKRLAANSGLTSKLHVFNVNYTGPTLTIEGMMDLGSNPPIAFSPDGTKLALTASADKLQVFDVHGATPSFAVLWTSPHTGSDLQCLAWEPCGNYLLAADRGTDPQAVAGALHFIRAGDGSLKSHYDDEVGDFHRPVQSLCYSPDGQFFAYGRIDGTVGFCENPYYVAAKLASVAASPATIVGGATSPGTINLDCFAPIGDAVVTLVSSNPAIAAVPATVTVGVGTKSQGFSIATVPVLANTSVTLTATYNGITKKKVITVTPPVLVALGLNPAALTGGSSSTGTVTMSGAVLSDTIVTMTSSNTAVHIPATVTIPTGSTSASFTVTTDAVLAKGTATITARLGSVTKTANLTVNPPAYSSFTLSPNPVVGGNTVTATVTMSGPVAANTTVNLTNANTKAHLPSASVTITAGFASVSFVITTDAVTKKASGAVKASIGSVTKSVTLSVTP